MPLKYPTPRTRSKPRDEWPTAQELTDDELTAWLRDLEKADKQNRLLYGSGKPLTPKHEEHRNNINRAYAELFEEAMQRGLRNPWSEQDDRISNRA